MAEMKIQELARELKKTSSEIIEMCAKKGIGGLEQQSVLSESQVKEIRAAVKEAAPAKKKMHLVFHPEHSSKPLPQRRRTAPAKETAPPEPDTREEKKAQQPDAVLTAAVKEEKTGQPAQQKE